jgi:uncharacterized protein YndB with AHSA1/START domain
MSSVSRVIKATPEQVWDILSDGWLYPVWVVGASRMREVDEQWPDAGATLHHSVGSWPALINDSTTVVESEPRSLLRLRARAWPAGEAEVVLHLEPHAGGTTHVTIEEDIASGPTRAIPQPVRAPLLSWRNTETLRRLAFIAERRGR